MDGLSGGFRVRSVPFQGDTAAKGTRSQRSARARQTVDPADLREKFGTGFQPFLPGWKPFRLFNHKGHGEGTEVAEAGGSCENKGTVERSARARQTAVGNSY